MRWDTCPVETALCLLKTHQRLLEAERATRPLGRGPWTGTLERGRADGER
jgi:hypothetical protein